MVIFLGICNRYQANQMNLCATMRKMDIFIVIKLKKHITMVAITATKT